MYKFFYDKRALKDLKDIPKLKAANLEKNEKKLIDFLRNDPYKTPPPFEKL